mmetsp:Transcript_15640/g.37564  ORF Transcript_15640/g.37564 Transcript_15640/m.37564 type:complete len:88 (+) Transcript_15640:2-265(+)
MALGRTKAGGEEQKNKGFKIENGFGNMRKSLINAGERESIGSHARDGEGIWESFSERESFKRSSSQARAKLNANSRQGLKNRAHTLR